MRFLAKSLMGKLVLLFLLIALIPVAIVGYLSYRTAKSALQEASLGKLSTSRDQTREKIIAAVRQAFGDIEYPRINSRGPYGLPVPRVRGVRHATRSGQSQHRSNLLSIP